LFSKIKKGITFDALNNRTNYTMTLAKFIGFLIFMGIFTLGFWLMIFLVTYIIPYWLFGNFMENRKLKKEAKKAAAAAQE
jgi:hypothetical protein